MNEFSSALLMLAAIYSVCTLYTDCIGVCGRGVRKPFPQRNSMNRKEPGKTEPILAVAFARITIVAIHIHLYPICWPFSALWEVCVFTESFVHEIFPQWPPPPFINIEYGCRNRHSGIKPQNFLPISSHRVSTAWFCS